MCEYTYTASNYYSQRRTIKIISIYIISIFKLTTFNGIIKSNPSDRKFGINITMRVILYVMQISIHVFYKSRDLFGRCIESRLQYLYIFLQIIVNKRPTRRLLVCSHNIHCKMYSYSHNIFCFLCSWNKIKNCIL